MAEISGSVIEIIYENQDTDYTICVIESSEGIATVTGAMPTLYLGVTLTAYGTWVSHPNYGEQFKADRVSVSMPSSIDGMRDFLSSGLISGVGDSTAQNIIKVFGIDTFNIIENSPGRLKEVKGITTKKVNAIIEAYSKYKDSTDTLQFLSRYGIGTSMAMKTYKVFGKDTEKIVGDNPYSLIERVGGFRFDVVDNMAQELGFPQDSPIRVRAHIIHCLEQQYTEGHVYLPEEILYRQVVENMRMELSHDTYLYELENLEKAKKVILAKLQKQNEVVNAVYLYYMFNAERAIEDKLKILKKGNKKVLKNAERVLDRFEKNNNIVLDNVQREAVITSANQGVTIITGGPGTGKTTIIKALIKILEDAGEKCLLAAPTGRAAKRMANACDLEAKTIHRLLEIDFVGKDDDVRNDAEVKFRRNSERPLETDCVIIDEVSMVDTILMYRLLDAMKSGMRLVLVGDNDQLPSVGPGRVLRDSIMSKIFPTIVLNTVYRQNPNSLISYNAQLVNRGEFPELNTKDGDFFLMTVNSGRECLDLINDLVSRRLPAKYGLNPFNDIQVITPGKRSVSGNENLNISIQNTLNPDSRGKKFLKLGDRILRDGDRVMQTRNNYNLEWSDYDDPALVGEGVFNGEMGVVKEIDEKNKLIYVLYDDNRYVCYDRMTVGEIELCYSITVHKSQGSEFPYCVISISNIPKPLRTRNLIYTAITRAKTLCVIIGSREELSEMINNDVEDVRFTSLFFTERGGV